MTIAEREKKLKRAEAQLKRTLTRIKRLQTAASRWESRVVYQRREIAYEQALKTATQGQGRMFRRSGPGQNGISGY